MDFFKVISFFVFNLFACPIFAESDEHHHHDDEENLFEQHTSHVHGHANAQISYESGVLNITNSFSSSDIFGFEHPPRNDEQLNTIKMAVLKLEMTDNIFSFDDASCKSESVQIESDLIKTDEESHDEHHDHSNEHHHNDALDKDSHTDVFAKYVFKCNAENLNSIEYLIFDRFPSIEKIEVQFISHNHQAIFTATRSNRIQKLN